MKNKSSISRNFYIINFLQLFTGELTGTCFVIYLLHQGLNLYNSNIILSTLFATIFIMEIPTGIIADLYGRKVSVVLGIVCEGISYVIFVTSSSFYQFIIAQIIAGIGLSLQSGALEAWVVDYLKFSKSDLKLEDLFSKSFSIRNFAGMFCGIIAAFLAQINIKLPWLISIVLTMITCIFCFIVMDEPYFKKTKTSYKNMHASIKIITKDSFEYGVKNKLISVFFLVGILISFSNSSGNAFQQPRLVGLFGHGVWIFGWIKAIYSMFMLLGSWLIKYLSSKNVKHNQLVSYSCFMIGFWLILGGVFNSFYSVTLMFFIYEIGRGMYGPSAQTFLNYRIPSDKRATILSFASATSQIGMILGLVVTGIISKNFNNLNTNQMPIRISWILCGCIALIASFIGFYFLSEKFSANKTADKL